MHLLIDNFFLVALVIYFAAAAPSRIPTEFERLEALQVLRLGHNRLTGESRCRNNARRGLLVVVRCVCQGCNQVIKVSPTLLLDHVHARAQEN